MCSAGTLSPPSGLLLGTKPSPAMLILGPVVTFVRHRLRARQALSSPMRGEKHVAHPPEDELDYAQLSRLSNA